MIDLATQLGVKAVPHVCGQRNGPGVAQNLDRFPGLIDDHRAVFAVLKVTLEFLFHDGIKITVDIV